MRIYPQATMATMKTVASPMHMAPKASASKPRSQESGLGRTSADFSGTLLIREWGLDSKSVTVLVN